MSDDTKYPTDEQLAETLTKLAKRTSLKRWQVAAMEETIRAVYDCGHDEARFLRLLKELRDNDADPRQIRLASIAWRRRRMS